MFKNKVIMVTGGTGSFGKKFITHTLKNIKFKKIIIYSRDELKQHDFKNSLNNKDLKKIRFFIGDIRDKARLKMAMKDVNIVVHAAALKQVPTIEYNPFEAVKTNINGAQNIIETSLETSVEKVIALSTDKASSPINVYGATKLTSDKLFISANNYSGRNNIKFSVVRYGNVFGSRGSVIPIFLGQKNGVYNITSLDMTRFNITLEEGVKFVLFSLKNMVGGEVFVPKLKSYRITDVVKAISNSPKIKIIGVRPGEKIHEEMISRFDSVNTLEFKNFFIILPDLSFKGLKLNKFKKKFKGQSPKLCKPNFSYNSYENKNFLKVNEIKNLIKIFQKK